MTAHLAVARALRPATAPDGKDGMLARAILTALVGLQRNAMTIVRAFEHQATSDADRRWVRALKLRITGDWRGTAPTASDSLLEKLEHARAIRSRLSIDQFLDYLDTLPEDRRTDWPRLAYLHDVSVETGSIFTPDNVVRELTDSAYVWLQYHRGEPTEDTLLEDLNELPINAIRQDGGVRVIDWGTWAAHQQRHLAAALIAVTDHEENIGRDDPDFVRRYEDAFGRLRLYPIVLRWMAREPTDYQRAVQLAQPLAERSPELLTQEAWTLLLEKPSYVNRPAPFPLDVSWFTPAVPIGTAFDLAPRVLRPGPVNPRVPSREQLTQWALDMPYDHWTQWGKEFLSIEGRPTIAVVRTALSPLFGYDREAITKMLDYMRPPDAERLTMTKALCDLVAGECHRLGELLLIMNREAEAAAAYGRWDRETRDRVAVAAGVTWLVRYEQRTGNASHAEAIARKAGEAYSHRGLRELAEWFDRSGRYAEAESTYRRIVERYEDTEALGTFLMRQAKRTSNPDLQVEASDLLRSVFPSGLEPLVKRNLPPVASDGVGFATFGPRPLGLGLQSTDIIVGVDGWRVHDASQYAAVTRFQHDDLMALTIWRDGRYQDLQVRVPERVFGTRFKDHRGPPPALRPAATR
jgi:tetratricopeptide (TPR) repeat protein